MFLKLWYIQSLEYISHLYAENNQIKPNTFIRYNEGKKVIHIINQDFEGENTSRHSDSNPRPADPVILRRVAENFA